eukprot:2709511-Amphidinium_carterae.2
MHLGQHAFHHLYCSSIRRGLLEWYFGQSSHGLDADYIAPSLLFKPNLRWKLARRLNLNSS